MPGTEPHALQFHNYKKKSVPSEKGNDSIPPASKVCVLLVIYTGRVGGREDHVSGSSPVDKRTRK